MQNSLMTLSKSHNLHFDWMLHRVTRMWPVKGVSTGLTHRDISVKGSKWKIYQILI